jgi:hypothetical protein
MNDFTKEELMNILYALEHLYEPPFDLPKMYLLRNKVESMIDNYCEHESNILSQEERERKFKIYREEILPKYDNDPDKVPPHLEPDFNEGWK